MKIKSLIYSLLIFGGVVSLGSCQNDVNDPLPVGEGQQLTLLPSVADRNKVEVRAAGNIPFFENGNDITVQVKTSRTGSDFVSYPYTYNNGTFAEKAQGQGFFFPADQTFISELKAFWPSFENRGAVITDQRDLDQFKLANRLTAHVTEANIMPTADPVPLVFQHEQSKITFRLAGQNASGLIIKSLLFELENVDLDDGQGERQVGFWAYCEGTGTLNAEVIVPAGVVFGPGINDGKRMEIGLVKVGAEGTTDNDYEGIMYIPNSTHIKLQKNHDYLVTLTPEGYDLMATISIAGFPQPDGDHVGVPFQLPVLNEETERYEISTIAQLVTVSWLLTGDLNGELQSDWSTRTFDIVNDIEVSDRIKAEGDRYLNISTLNNYKNQFSNADKVTYSDGTNVFN